ncbi:diguanylate cyclase/phosphodiesterase (GGDEF & EAL domains) with PAS/PAC sensor(s) [hydrothermal vent metagenome]|uniref:Diguanylate cyclase/phosphodiesterase (GGDEF & EAL domains) with PAS/PAC sensor(S) n=1 Tax=hydrothermal vent metagenome TaxID=652676 RepID=A0A3B0XHE0_9ZZZZ
MTDQEFQTRFLRLIALTWLLPPMVGFSFLLYIEVFTFDQLLIMLGNPLKQTFLVGGFLLALFYFHRFSLPLKTFLSAPDPINQLLALKVLQRFPLHFWLVFISYISLAPAAAIISLEMSSSYVARPVDWFRIHLVALIVSIIVGLPIFIRIYDLFGKTFGHIQLQRPIITLKTRVFLIGALIPLLIDTMLVQYYWTRTGFFSAETFIIWVLLECLAIAGTLLFVRSFNQSLAPLNRLINTPADSLTHKIHPASTDELGIFATQLGKLLDGQQLHQQRLAFSNDLLKASHSHENLARLLQTIVDRTCQTLDGAACFLSLYDPGNNRLVCVARSNADYNQEGHFHVSLNDTSLVIDVFKSSQPQIVQNAHSDSRINQKLRQLYNIQSSAAVPLIIEDETIGVLQIASINKFHHYNDHEIKTLQAFAQEAAVIQTFFEGLKERRKAETAITQIMQGVSAATGADFFNAMTINMANILRADSCGIVTILPDSGREVETLAYFHDGKIIPNLQYTLDGTPCETIIGKKPRTFSKNIQETFPQDTHLCEQGIESYVGIPLSDSHNKPQGLLFAMFRRTIENIEFNESVMRIFAARTSAEIERTQTEKRIKHMAYYDSLTGLPNRVYLHDRIQQAIAHAERNNTRLAVMILDLDHFKKINDSLGHPVGDALLIEVAQRLRKCIRKEDTVARLGGDEFIILQSGFESRESAINHISHIAKQLHETLKIHYTISEHSLMITASCGIALYPNDGKTTEQLIKHSDTALYKAKERGRDGYQFFSSEMNAAAVERLEMESDIHRAIKNKEFEVVYQPKVCISDNRIIGAEALLRWYAPGRGYISPDSFIPIADETGQIIQLGEFVLHQACEQTSRFWCNSGSCDEHNRLSINVSPRQFKQDDFIDKLQKTLDQHQTKTECIELEVTENILIEDTRAVSKKLQILKDLGIKISIDDFGTGYASLRYLQQLPIDMIKIDRSFITHINENEGDLAIVKTIITMAKNLHIDIIAEGVETREQIERLEQLGCPYYQGYYYSKPVSRDEFFEMLQQQRQASKKMQCK